MNTVHYHETGRSRKVLEWEIGGQLNLEDILIEFACDHPKAHPLAVDVDGYRLWTNKENIYLAFDNSD